VNPPSPLCAGVTVSEGTAASLAPTLMFARVGRQLLSGGVVKRLRGGLCK
jgi:hypothetical protein